MPASVVYPKSHEGLAAAASAGRRSGPPQFSSANQLILFFYLLGYNNVSFMGWFWVFYTTLYCYLSAGFKYDNVHDLSWQGLTIIQSAALLEVVNSWCGKSEEEQQEKKVEEWSIHFGWWRHFRNLGLASLNMKLAHTRCTLFYLTLVVSTILYGCRYSFC